MTDTAIIKALKDICTELRLIRKTLQRDVRNGRPVIYTDLPDLETYSEDMEDTERGVSGFGSTGK